ncbi:MAG TPA: YoaK family protein [Polyangiaceae bacterium]|nr:YoaK family protein [Polyangiaceae bacterium]
MFRHEGPARDPKANMILAGYLAAIAGFVNSGGFIMIGSFTSHVTGSIGRLGDDIARGEMAAAVSALLLILAFFGGAVAASLVLERSDHSQPARRYALALLVEAGVLLLFVFIAGLSRATHPRILDAQAALLCIAMGMQNSMVTRLSGAVVRTTHLTGVVTDLGIEVARWYRWYQAQLPLPTRRPSEVLPERPAVGRISLLSAVTGSFVAGAVLGATLTLRASRWAMCFPAGAILLASGFAYHQGRPRKKGTA